MSVRLLRPLAMALTSLSVDADRFFGELGLPSIATASWEQRFSAALIPELWRRLVEVTHDGDFALHAAEHVDLTTCDVVTYLESAAATVLQAFEKKFAYLPIMTDAVEWSLEERGDQATLSLFDRPVREPCRSMAEYLLAARHVFLVRFGPPTWRLSELTFRHAAPPDTREHRRLFGVEPAFGCASDSFSFCRSLLSEPMRGRDETLTSLLSRYAEQVLPAFSVGAPASWRERVRHELTGGGDPGLTLVARKLGVSSRSLQRALADEGTSYAALLTAERRALAEQLLRRRELGISEIAVVLGFSGPPAFHRAFRRWTGLTPQAFRAKHFGPSFREPALARLSELLPSRIDS